MLLPNISHVLTIINENDGKSYNTVPDKTSSKDIFNLTHDILAVVSYCKTSRNVLDIENATMY